MVGASARAAQAADALDNERRARKERARAARADKAVRVARVQHIEPHGEGRILLVLKGRRRIVADLDHLGRVGDLHALGELLAAALLQGLQNFFRFSGQDDVHAVLLLRHQRALDGRERGEIAAMASTMIFTGSLSFPVTQHVLAHRVDLFKRARGELRIFHALAAP